jgi:hypothetical protein
MDRMAMVQVIKAALLKADMFVVVVVVVVVCCGFLLTTDNLVCGFLR